MQRMFYCVFVPILRCIAVVMLFALYKVRIINFLTFMSFEANIVGKKATQMMLSFV